MKSRLDVVELLLWVFFILSLWAISSVRLGLIPLISIDLSLDKCSGWNELFVNLSYSYIAGIIVYLVTVELKEYISKRRTKIIRKRRTYIIYTSIDSILMVYANKKESYVPKSMNGLMELLDSRKLFSQVKVDKIFEECNIGQSATYITLIRDKTEASKQHTFDFIQLYKDYLSEEQLILLEAYTEMNVINLSHIVAFKGKKHCEESLIKQVLQEFCKFYVAVIMLKKYVGGYYDETDKEFISAADALRKEILSKW